MEQYALKTVNVRFDGDYCGDCPFCLHVDGTAKAMCFVFRTKNEDPRTLKTRKVDRDFQPKYYPLTRAEEPVDEPVRCTECLSEFRSYGPNRITPRGFILYPTPQQMLRGDWLACAKILDLAQALDGWFVRALYGYTDESDDDDAQICQLEISVRKGERGKVLELGGTEGFRGLDKLPKGGGEALMRWVGDLYGELVDVAEAETDRLYWEKHNQ